MFRSFIYLDEDKFYTYKRQLEGNNQAQPKALSQRKKSGLSASFNGSGLSSETETKIDGEFIKDIAFDYDKFETELKDQDGDEFFDCVLNSDYDPTTVPAMSLLRICNRFVIPEEFDAINLIDRFKPFLMGQIDSQPEDAQEALESMLNSASADIPFIVEMDEFTFAGKLNAKHLFEDYSNLEDYADQEVYMLYKVVGMIHKENVEIFDPWKDFIKLPRSFRRQMPKDDVPNGFDKIIVEGPVLKVEVIAIYK